MASLTMVQRLINRHRDISDAGRFRWQAGLLASAYLKTHVLCVIYSGARLASEAAGRDSIRLINHPAEVTNDFWPDGLRVSLIF